LQGDACVALLFCAGIRMALLQQPIQRKLSALLGAAVTFDKLNLSLLSGTIEAVGVTVAGEDRSSPLLTVARVRAEVAVARALKGEIVVRSLTIERPVVRFVRRADGTTNLPKRDKKPDDATTPPATNDDAGNDKTSWKLDVEKLLVVDGEVHVRLDAYELAVPRVLIELKRTRDGYAITLLAEQVARRDVPIDIGTIKGTGTIGGASDLTALPDASINAELDVEGFGRVRYTATKIRTLDGEVEFQGGFSIARVMSLLKR
jgi:uncharacterized protein involved in outer membrane biogenesis